MSVAEMLAIVGLICSAAAAALSFAVLLRQSRTSERRTDESGVLSALDECVRRLDRSVRDEFLKARDETGTSARALREEVLGSFHTLAEALRKSLGDLTQGQNTRLDAFGQHLSDARISADGAAKAQREEIQNTLRQLGEMLAQNLNGMSEIQRERLTRIAESVGELGRKNEEKQDALRQTVEMRLEKLQSDNAEKLEQMRATVDEKLQGTLEQRLGASFKQVSENLEQVFRSVGEMQKLATGVGDLKRVLTNVKARGTWGEVTLGMLLEQVLAPDQYGQNIEVVPSSGQRIEYAVRLPGAAEGSGGPLWLPIDSKFPTEDYERLMLAAEQGDGEGVDAAGKAIEARIRAAAKEICHKHVHPPHSTDFAILFLPTEGLFAEVIRRPGLIDALQRDCRIVVTGPTTLLATLTSLRLGFRTLAIQKRSSEVWQVLAAVKGEFEKFGAVMDKVQKKLQEAQSAIEEDVSRRRRAIDRKLRGIEALPEAEAITVLGLGADIEVMAEAAQ